MEILWDKDDDDFATYPYFTWVMKDGRRNYLSIFTTKQELLDWVAKKHPTATLRRVYT